MVSMSAAIERAGAVVLDIALVLDGRKPIPEFAGYRVRVGPETAILSFD